MAGTHGGETSSTVGLLWYIWCNKIKHDYMHGLIPNERTLQAAIYHYLREEGLEVFTEIETFLNEDAGVPDLIVAKEHHVEAVIELKMVRNKGTRIQF